MSILKRTVFFDNTSGIKRFWDFALVQTTLGAMVEPFTANDRKGGSPVINYDPTDMMVRIDEIEGKPIDVQQLVLSGGFHLHGGTTLPRNGR